MKSGQTLNCAAVVFSCVLLLVQAQNVPGDAPDDILSSQGFEVIAEANNMLRSDVW